MVDHRSVDVRGIRLAYQVSASPDAPPLVLVHALGENATDWEQVVPALARSRRVGCKRRSRPGVDEAEDGGRAIALEEGISARVFCYASRHQNARHVDHELLITIDHMTAHLEVSVLRAKPARPTGAGSA
jgi:hypothetical protein